MPKILDAGHAGWPQRGFAWSCPLLEILDRTDAQARISATAQVADRAGSAGLGERWTMFDGDSVYVVPLLAAVLYGRDLGLVLRWTGVTMLISADGAASVDRTPFDLTGSVGPLTIEIIAPGSSLENVLAIAARPALLPAAFLARLSAYAARTTVPVSAASRALGAGSTRSDND